MKILLEEYLKILKEKDELDLLLCDLLLLDGYTIANRPKSGERQYGVDVLAQKEDDTYLFIIKQKDITRDTWDSGKDSVRQSINEVLDVYLPAMIPQNHTCKQYHIVLVTNGYILAAVQPNWVQYQNQHKTFNGIPIVFDEWTLDVLVQKCAELAFSNILFGRKNQSDLRKVLYYIDENEFNNLYYEKVIDRLLTQIANAPQTQQVKHLTTFYTCVALICTWASNIQKYKMAINISEYSIIKFWQFLYKHKRFEDKTYLPFLFRLIELYRQYNLQYVTEVGKISDINHAISHTNPLEDGIMVYDIIGRLASFGLFHYFTGNEKETQKIVNTMIEFMNSNPVFKYPIFDNHIIELSLAFLLLKYTGRNHDLRVLIECIVNAINVKYYLEKKHPAPYDTYEEALQIHFGKQLEYTASILFAGLLEWSCIEGDSKAFDELVSFIQSDFPTTTIQTWQMNVSEEGELYNINAAHKAGVSIPFTGISTLDKFKTDLDRADSSIDIDKFSFVEYCFPSVAILSCRYFRTPIPPQFWRQAEKIQRPVKP